MSKTCVSKVLTTPRYYRAGNVEWWTVNVEYRHDNVISQRILLFTTREEAENVKEGYEFNIEDR